MVFNFFSVVTNRYIYDEVQCKKRSARRVAEELLDNFPLYSASSCNHDSLKKKIRDVVDAVKKKRAKKRKDLEEFLSADFMPPRPLKKVLVTPASSATARVLTQLQQENKVLKRKIEESTAQNEDLQLQLGVALETVKEKVQDCSMLQIGYCNELHIFHH